MKQSLENWQEAATRSLDKMYQRAVKAETEAQELRDTLEGWDGQVAALEERAEAAEAKLAEATEDLDSCREVREELEARLAEVEKERNAISTQCGEERKARKVAEAINADEVLAKRTNLLARIESLEVTRNDLRASMDRARELAEKARPLRDATGAKDDFTEIARLLSGDEDYIERHKLYAPPVTDDSLFEVVPASFTDEDVERVAEAIYAALEDSYSIERETTEAPTRDEKLAASRAALSAYLEPTTKGDT